MSISALYTGASALQAFPQGMESVAYNVATGGQNGYSHTDFVENFSGGVSAHTHMVASPAPNLDLVSYVPEMVNSIVLENAHAANAVSVQSLDDTLGVIVNLSA